MTDRTPNKTDSIVEEMETLLDQATAMARAGNGPKAANLLKQILALAHTLPKKKQKEGKP